MVFQGAKEVSIWFGFASRSYVCNSIVKTKVVRKGKHTTIGVGDWPLVWLILNVGCKFPSSFILAAAK